jgi:hypothetical protein
MMAVAQPSPPRPVVPCLAILHRRIRMRSARLKLLAVVLVCAVVAALAPALMAQKPQTPTEVYLAYRAVYEKAKSIDETFPFFEPEAVAKFKSMPKDKAKAMWDMMKAMDNYTGVKVIKETIKGDTCVLDVEATKPDKSVIKGTVDMLKKTTWLVGQENWPM